MPKFLIMRFSSIGDIVLTSPVVRCIKQQVKDAEVHFVTKENFRSVIEFNPFIDKKFYLKDDLKSLLAQLKAEQYDCVIDLHKNIRTLWIKMQLGKKSFSFNKLNFEKWLIVNFKINRLPGVHIVDRYLETVKSFGVKNDGEGLNYFLPDELASLSGDTFNASLQEIPFEQYKYVAFAIGAQHATKRLPIEKIISICKKSSMPVILLGGKEDADHAEEISKAVDKNIYNACGKLSLHQSAAVVKFCNAIITHDTGLMHIAAAFNKKIISVWGNTIPEFGMYPYFKNKNESIIVEVKGLNCRPCSKIGFDKCPKGHFNCMNKIEEDMILKSIMQ
ncbi:MAG: glycosyltransferase family 9 protein [Bacteroidia bacterium]